MIADMLTVNLPYSEYWLPLLIGAGVGFLAILAMKATVARPAEKTAPDQPPPPRKEYDPFTEGSRSDQRRSFRRSGSTVKVYFAFPDRKNHADEAWVMDRSMGGLCLGVAGEVPVGAVLSLLPVNAPPMTPMKSARTVSRGISSTQARKRGVAR